MPWEAWLLPGDSGDFAGRNARFADCRRCRSGLTRRLLRDLIDALMLLRGANPANWGGYIVDDTLIVRFWNLNRINALFFRSRMAQIMQQNRLRFHCHNAFGYLGRAGERCFAPGTGPVPVKSLGKWQSERQPAVARRFPQLNPNTRWHSHKKYHRSAHYNQHGKE